MKIRLFVNTGFAACKHEDFIGIDDAEWNGMSEAERKQFLEEEAQVFMNNHIEWGAYPGHNNSVRLKQAAAKLQMHIAALLAAVKAEEAQENGRG